jgi:pimeloyl-ACP methyl ester carboxylesterase
MRSVVLVHGLWMPGIELGVLRSRLSVAGFVPRRFRYRSVANDIDTSAAQLAEYLVGVPGDTVHLVGHSLGGLVIARLVERFGSERIGRVVCLASPFCGSAAGAGLRRLPGGRWLLGRAMAQGLVEAPGRHWDGRRELGVIAGNVPVGVGRLFGRLDEPNDGTVAVAETRLPGATDHIVVRASHFSILWSADAAIQVIAFLESGRFARRDA